MSDRKVEAIDVVALGHGRYQVDHAGRRTIAFAVAGRDTWVFHDGRVYQILGADSRGTDAGARLRSAGPADDAFIAPMPATVLAIHAAPGRRVARNDVVMVLEAMKMELPIRSPRDGVVKTVGCQVGELVQPGTVLIELEDGNSERIDP